MTAVREISTPTSTRWDYAREHADRLADPYSTPPIPVLEIAEDNGVDVVFDEFDGYKDTVAGFCDFAAKKIYVNANDYVPREMFTIAHELGHWVLHRDLFLSNPDRYNVLPRFQQPDKTDPLEQEANCFAANLLVPSRLLKPVKHAPISQLSEMFGVSKQMMENRLKDWRV